MTELVLMICMLGSSGGAIGRAVLVEGEVSVQRASGVPGAPVSAGDVRLPRIAGAPTASAVSPGHIRTRTITTRVAIDSNSRRDALAGDPAGRLAMGLNMFARIVVEDESPGQPLVALDTGWE